MISISLFLGVFVLIISQIYALSRFYEEKINLKKFNTYLILIILTIAATLNSIFINGFIRIIFSVIMLAIGNFMIFKKKLNETIVSTIFCYLILSLADIISALLLIIIFSKDANFIKNEYFATFIGNILVSFVFIIIIMIPIVKTTYMKLIDLTNKLKIKNLILSCILLIISINFLMAIIYYDMNSIYVIITNSLLLLIYSYIVFKAINEKNNNIMIKAENASLMNSLSEYENMVDRQRIDNHENKNQLLIIKNMINKKDKNVIKYIDTIIKDEKEDDEALYTKVKTIPSGGLQGIIYQKMLTMKDNNISFSLDVSRDVRKIDLDSLGMENNYKLCKIIGVLLDNAIEESIKIENKCVMISLYIDEDMLIIEIANRFDSEINLEKIDDEGFTSKGEGHGYGLSLVKNIISENSDTFTNERKIINDVFKQTIKVKIK